MFARDIISLHIWSFSLIWFIYSHFLGDFVFISCFFFSLFHTRIHTHFPHVFSTLSIGWFVLTCFWFLLPLLWPIYVLLCYLPSNAVSMQKQKFFMECVFRWLLESSNAIVETATTQHNTAQHSTAFILFHRFCERQRENKEIKMQKKNRECMCENGIFQFIFMLIYVSTDKHRHCAGTHHLSASMCYAVLCVLCCVALCYAMFVCVCIIPHSLCATVGWPNRQCSYHLPLSYDNKKKKTNKLAKSEFVLLFQCFNSISILCELNLFIFSFLLYILVKFGNGAMKRRKSPCYLFLLFFFRVFQCASHIRSNSSFCWIYHILVSFIVLNFCNNFMCMFPHFYIMMIVCVSVCTVHKWPEDETLNVHRLKRIHIKSTQLQKNTFSSSMLSLCQIYICILKCASYSYGIKAVCRCERSIPHV